MNSSKMAVKKWEGMTPEQQADHIKKLKRGTRKFWASLSDTEKAKRVKKMLDGRKKRRS